MKLTPEEILAAIPTYATPGHRASGTWLATVPEDHLIGVSAAWGMVADEDHPMRASAAEFLCRVMSALLTAERGRPVLSSIEEGNRYVSHLGPACRVEMTRRAGRCVVEPPLGSIFEPGASTVRAVAS